MFLAAAVAASALLPQAPSSRRAMLASAATATSSLLLPQSPAYAAPGAARAPPPVSSSVDSAARVQALVAAGASRQSAELGDAVSALVADSTPPAAVNFGPTSGTWHVVHAPHIDTLSSLLLTRFDPIEYRLDGGEIASYVRYRSKLPFVGDGWLCTSGTISDAASAASTVRLTWDQIWWVPGGDEAATPPPPSGGALRPLVQALGRAAFIEAFSVFPVLHVGDELAVFQFAGWTVCAARQPPDASRPQRL